MSERIKLTLAFGVFFVFAVLQIGFAVVKGTPVTGEFVGMLLLSLGFVASSIGILPRLWKRRPSNQDPERRITVSAVSTRGPLQQSTLFYVGLALGLLMWVAAPIAMILDGMAWDSLIGSGRRAISVGWLAAIVWGVTALVAGAFVWAWIKARRSK